ncbi:MAG: hypothetical protein RIS87_746 [Pseudomonadota bacterium]
MRKSNIKQLSLAVFLAFIPFVAYSAGLGDLNIHSALGEPLKVDIELLSVSPEELSTLVAGIASEEAYVAQGLKHLAIHNNIKAEITKKLDGVTILTLRTVQPINDPYLGLLVQIDWAAGRQQREYTLLLDPPEYKSTATEAALTPISPPSSSDLDVTKKATNNSSDNEDHNQVAAASTADATSLIAPENKSLDAVKEISIVTERGDTLEAVARDMQIDGVSLDQMLLGLYEQNKSAFSGANINRLKVGQIIKRPSKEILTAINEQQAKQTIKVHASNWNTYRNSLAKNLEQTNKVVESEQKQVASGKIVSAEDKANSINPGLQDVVKLSAGDQAKNANAGESTDKTANAKVIDLQDEAIASEKSLQDAQGRASALEKQINDMQKLLALKNQTMTELQKKAEPALSNKPSINRQTTENAALGFIANLINSANFLLLGLAFAAAFLGAIWIYSRNKNKNDIDSFERLILSPDRLYVDGGLANSSINDAGQIAEVKEILKESISKQSSAENNAIPDVDLENSNIVESISSSEIASTIDHEVVGKPVDDQSIKSDEVLSANVIVQNLDVITSKNDLKVRTKKKPVKKSTTNASEISPINLDVSFDFPAIKELTKSDEIIPDVDAADPKGFEAKTFDFSKISLDVADTEIEDYAVLNPTSSLEDESSDVNGKLDLAIAYIDKNDKKGAIKLLQEVVKEGGVKQKSRAKLLLEGLV